MSNEELTQEQVVALSAINEQHRDAVRGVAERLWREAPKQAEHEINSIRPRRRIEVVAVLRAFRPVTKDKSEIKFDKLRGQHLARRKKLDDLDSQIRSKYGEGWSEEWLSSSEKRQLVAARDQVDKAGNAFFEYLTSISPRDWSYGVSAYWVRESLTFADAVRPVNEQLSVVPPMAYGATRPRT